MSLTFAQRMALGAERAKYRRRLQEVMDNNGLSGAALARELGVSSQAVYSTLTGKIHSPIVLNWLREHGAAEEYLCDPRVANR